MARDDFHKPKPRKAPVKAVVNGVLSAVSAMGTSLVSLLSGLLAAVLILYSGYVLYDTFYTQENAKSGWDLLQYKPVILEDVPAPEAGENRLAKINSDYRAWLTLYETNIDYPVMQGDNDLYYANHDIYKEVSLTGAIYLAAGNNGSITDSYNLIYGHHMDNGAMFGALDLFRDQSYFNAHREGLLVSRSAVYDLYAFAVAETDAYQNRIYAVGDRMDDLLTFLRANLTDADPDGADWSRDTTVPIFDEAPLDGATKIVALSTCAAANTNGRLVVFYVATLRNLITVNAQGSTWVYDGQAHTLQDLSDDGSGVYFTTNYPGDEQYPTTVEYSIDGGQTWTTTPPSVRDVAEVPVLVRATNPNYDTVEVTVLLRITPRIVTVTVGDYSKLSGSDDPEFTATVDGLLEGDEIRFTIVREEGEAPGTYAITPTGDEIQGNYQVVYHSGRLRIINNPAKPTPTPGPTPVVDEPKPDEPEPDPLVIFDPRGTGRAVWALVNLICLIITIYLFFPLLHLDAKFDRPRKMKKINKCKRQLRLMEETPRRRSGISPACCSWSWKPGKRRPPAAKRPPPATPRRMSSARRWRPCSIR